MLKSQVRDTLTFCTNGKLSGSTTVPGAVSLNPEDILGSLGLLFFFGLKL